MKRILFFSVFMTACMLPLFGQDVWDNIFLAGGDAKIASSFKQPRFSAAITGCTLLGELTAQFVDLAPLQQAAFAPGTVEQIVEELGGEFFIGSFSDPNPQNARLPGKTSYAPGIRLGMGVSKRVELRTGVQYFIADWAGRFPVSVLPHFQSDPTQPQFFQGFVSVSLSAVLLDMEAVFFTSAGKFRPYAKGGARAYFPVENTIRAELAGIPLPLDFKTPGSKFSAFAGSGLRWFFGKNIFLEGGFFFGKLPGDDYQLAAEASFGWKF